MLRIVAKSLIRDNEIKNAIKLYKDLVKETVQEEGCISYELFQDMNNKKMLVIIEEWENEACFEAHKKSVHFTKIVPQISKIRISSEINILQRI
jgi:quinol monooxygenase YgiN